MTEFEEVFGNIDENGTYRPLHVKNPYKQVSPMDKNCLMKAAFVTVGGGVMGLFFGLFMNAMQFRDVEMIGSVRESTKRALKKDFQRIVGTGRGFAVFGGLFALFECQIEKLRMRDDSVNSFWAGAFTSMMLSINVMTPRGLIGTGMAGGLMGMAFYHLSLFSHF